MTKIRGFEPVSSVKNENVETLLPLRGTKTSAGYDFYTPVDIVIRPQQKVTVWTDVKSYMKEGEVLLLDVRSSMGIKNDLMLANTIGVIDSDYYDNESNEGNIGICLRNLKPSMEVLHYAYGKFPIYTTEEITAENGDKDFVYLTDYTHKNEAKLTEIDFPIPVIRNLEEENTIVIKAGERVAQGFFVNYLESDNCNSEKTRTGGIGSTGTK